MDRNNRHNKRHHSNWKNQKNHFDNKEQSRPSTFQHFNHENTEAQKKKEKAILDFKAKEVICPKCNQVITDLPSALADKATGNPVHFECVMQELQSTEAVGHNEKIAYIGQGRFGILYFENPRDQRHFTIKKIIDWESKEKTNEWREEISGLFSQIE